MMHDIFIDNNSYPLPTRSKLKFPILCVNNSPDQKVQFLGVTLDPTLNCKKHLETISSKVSNALFHLRAAKNLLSQEALTSLHYSLIHYHLIYAIHI